MARISPRVQTSADGVAWITGASSGIGRATALELARRGWQVAATARSSALLEALALEALALEGQGRIHPFVCDVTDATAMASCLGRIEEMHGPVALAFLNAGISVHSRAPELDLASMRRIVEVNIMGAFNALAPLIARMAARQNGQIALCASVAGYGGLPYAAAYCASKAAAINAAVSLAIECAPLGIKVQCVCPGFVDTPLTKKNDFPMPFMIGAEDAGRRIADGLGRSRFEIAFPRRMAWLLKAANLLPHDIYIRLFRWGIARKRANLPMARE